MVKAVIYNVNLLSLVKVSSNLGFQTESLKVQIGKDQEKAQSKKDSHSKNRDGKN